MQNSNLLTEKQSAERAKVGLDTIREYCKSGLLKAIYKDNEVHFNENEIVSMFHVSPEIPLPDFGAVSASIRADAPKADLERSISEHEIRPPEVEVEKINETPPSEVLFAVPTSTELSEPVKNLREQIEILKEERDWLRRQVERMESQFEREQMVLLSNSETLRRVVNSEPKQRSMWNYLLPWRWNTNFNRRAIPHER